MNRSKLIGKGNLCKLTLRGNLFRKYILLHIMLFIYIVSTNVLQPILNRGAIFTFTKSWVTPTNMLLLKIRSTPKLIEL